MKFEVRYLLKVGLLLLILLVGMAGGVVLDRQVLATYVPADNVPQEARPTFELLSEAWNLIDRVYVDRSAVDSTRLAYGALRGMVDALGDTGHSRFISPEEREARRQSQQNHFEGIGAYVEARDGAVVVTAPMEGSPAERAGISAGDVIVAVEGEPVSGLPVGEVVQRIVGPAGTAVTLTLENSASGEQRTVTVERAAVELERVTWTVIPGTSVGYVRVAAFSDDVSDRLHQALTALKAEGVTGLVLDLRNNPGGFLREAIGVGSEFLEAGQPIVLREDAEGNVVAMEARDGGAARELPLVVLVNEGSASASEIVAGALQDHGRATLVGQTTFGTGTVLNEFGLSDGSALMLATERWLTPDGRVIWHQGIEPDVTVALEDNAQLIVPRTVRDMSAADIETSGDAQLLEALRILDGA